MMSATAWAVLAEGRHVERDQLGPAEGPGEPKRQQRPVALPCQGAWRPHQDRGHDVGGRGTLCVGTVPIRQRMPLEPEEIAEAVLWMCSDLGAFVTGASI